MIYKQLPLGTSDFQKLIDGKLYYIDKSPLINDIIDGSEITLLPRPRRFGKTLNMSMLNYFFSNRQDYRYLFDGLAISDNAEAMKHCGQHPVIFLSFKDVKFDKIESTVQQMGYLIAEAFERHGEALDSVAMNESEAQAVSAIRRLTASPAELGGSIKLLSQLIFRHHQKPVVIIIDEYDMPINSAYTYGYYDELVGFLRNLLSGAFKDNPSLFKGVMTGILRIARESIFSGLNNIEVCSLAEADFNQYFGFTEPETDKLLADYQLTDRLPAVREWYNGYNFGEVTIYNPWSILHFAKKRGDLKPYWLNTSDNALVRDLIASASLKVKQELENLLMDDNAVVRKRLNENIVFRDINNSDDSVWNFLLFSGYLAYKNKQLIGKRIYVDLCIPNVEVASFYEDAILAWFDEQPSNDLTLESLLSLLLKADFDSFAKAFSHFCADTFSYFDVKGKQPERFYHAFVLGMLVQLQNSHTIKSNRESGYGRYDVCLIPHDKNQAGFVFEFKSVDELDNLTLEQACEVALQQIEKKQYVAELHTLGIETVYPIAIAFEGKRALVQVVE
ncbi:MAG: AAA family ATPase [Kangiellaceae bacterium]|nr:AAA family ATPase [Kangiellaceae bacterium]